MFMGMKQSNYYQNCLDEGTVYQDFVVQMLRKKKGWFISVFSSLFYQFNEGESDQGFEIKLDQPSASSGRILIETAERTSIDKKWTPSGIYRRDNTIHYIVGNYEFFYVFDVKSLRRVHEKFKKYKESGNIPDYFRSMYSDEVLNKKTGDGFLWDIKNLEAIDIYLFKIDCMDEGKELLKKIRSNNKDNSNVA